MNDRAQVQLISVVVPVYNEAENILPCLRGLYAALRSAPHELLLCYDMESDTTLPAVAAMHDRPPTVRLVKNDLGPGVLCAMRAGFHAATGDVVVTFMADLSDPPEVILDMARMIRQAGADVVGGSRYGKGGRQIGGPLVKRTLSRLAGVTLHWLAGLPTRDPTTNFRAYRRAFLDATTVESTAGFELALELTVKAHLQGYQVAEVPSVWRDRTAGQSRFRLFEWLPHYLRWYKLAILGRWRRKSTSAAIAAQRLPRG